MPEDVDRRRQPGVDQQDRPVVRIAGARAPLGIFDAAKVGPHRRADRQAEPLDKLDQPVAAATDLKAARPSRSDRVAEPGRLQTNPQA